VSVPASEDGSLTPSPSESVVQLAGRPRRARRVWSIRPPYVTGRRASTTRRRRWLGASADRAGTVQLEEVDAESSSLVNGQTDPRSYGDQDPRVFHLGLKPDPPVLVNPPADLDPNMAM